MNKFIGVGRLVRDPDVKAISSGKTVSNFTLAIDRRFKSADGKKEADFIPVVVWGKAAEFVAEYIKKGALVSVSGRIQVRTYDDKEGVKRYVTEIVADEVNSVGGKADKKPDSGNDLGDPDFTPMAGPDDECPF